MAEVTQKARILLRGRTAAEWATLNEVLRRNELGIETDTSRDKLGDGVTTWNALPYRLTGVGGAANVTLTNQALLAEANATMAATAATSRALDAAQSLSAAQHASGLFYSTIFV